METLGENLLPSSFFSLVEFSSFHYMTESQAPLMALSKKHSRHLETAHISCHMALSIFKSAIVYQTLLTLKSWTSSSLTSSLDLKGSVVRPNHGSKIHSNHSPRNYTERVHSMGILEVLLEFYLPHTSDVKVLYALPVLSKSKMRSDISIFTQIRGQCIFFELKLKI